MTVIHKIDPIDLTRRGVSRVIDVVQDDKYSRDLEIPLTSNSVAWNPPSDATVVVRFLKPDGTGGNYDTLPDGSDAGSIYGNVVTVALAPQVCTAPGVVMLAVGLVSGAAEINTFSVMINVQPNPGLQATSDGYFNVRGALADSGWEANMYLGTGPDGKVRAVKAPGGGGSYYILTDADKTEIAEMAAELVEVPDSSQEVPAYWQKHIDSKIAAVNALQDAGSKDCFSFIVLTDMHCNSNLGNNSALLAAEIIKQCSIKYALCLGDVRTRGLLSTKEAVNNEFTSIEEMLAPIRDRLLQTQGNHDAGYGSGDVDGDGTADTYAYELTPGEMFNKIYRKVSMVGDVHFAENGSAYYIDDVSAKVRYIILNTQCNYGGYDLNENGTVKNPTMRVFRYTQSQYDFLKDDALSTVPGEKWSVVVASHVPINHTGEMPEGPVMLGVLNAYKNKTTYSGNYAGTGESAPSYTNLFDKTADGFVDGYRFNSSGDETADTNAVITNYIPVKVGQILHIKGIATSVNGGTTYARLVGYDEGKNFTGLIALPTQTEGVFVQSEYDETVATYTLFKQPTGGDFAMADATVYIRIGGYLAGKVDDVVITLDEEIVESSAKAYDSVNVSVDFSKAKGTLIGYWAGHNHADNSWDDGFKVITTRCDAAEENDAALKAERVAGTVTEQSFDVVTVNTATRTIYCTKIGAGGDRVISY